MTDWVPLIDFFDDPCTDFQRACCSGAEIPLAYSFGAGENHDADAGGHV